MSVESYRVALQIDLISSYFFNENVDYLHFSQHKLIGLLENIDLETRQRM